MWNCLVNVSKWDINISSLYCATSVSCVVRILHQLTLGCYKQKTSDSEKLKCLGCLCAHWVYLSRVLSRIFLYYTLENVKEQSKRHFFRILVTFSFKRQIISVLQFFSSFWNQRKQKKNTFKKVVKCIKMEQMPKYFLFLKKIKPKHPMFMASLINIVEFLLTTWFIQPFFV